jgi:hypothetical protein
MTRPLAVTIQVFVLSILVGYIVPSIQDELILIGASLFAGILAIAIHELGHVLFGIANGFRFLFFTVGPVTIENINNRIHMKENKSWENFGGVASTLPNDMDTPHIERKWFWFAAGGPLMSISNAILCYTLYAFTAYNFLIYFTIGHIAIFLATIIPSKTGTDGRILLNFITNKEKIKSDIETVFINRELYSSKRPRDWDNQLKEICKKRIQMNTDPFAISTHYMFLYYYTADTEGLQESMKYVEPIVQAPLTKENKGTKIAFHAPYLLYYFLYKRESLTLGKLEELTKPFSKLEPTSYHLSLAIKQHLENKNCIDALTEVEKYIHKYSKFGFTQTEQEHVNMLKSKLAA